MTNLPNFILFSSLITLNVLFTAKSQDIELPTIPLKPLSVKFTSNHSIFSIIISDVNQTFIKNGTADFTDNINANPFCNFTPTTTTFDHLAEFTKDKTQWVTTAIVGDVIYALQYDFTIQALQPTATSIGLKGEVAYRFIDFGTYRTPLRQGFHYSNSMNVALVHVAYHNTLLLVVDDYVYFGSLSGGSLTFSSETGPLKLETRDFKKALNHNKRLYLLDTNGESLYIYDIANLKSAKYLGSIGAGLLGLKYANFTDFMAINNQYLLISDYNFGILKIDDVDLYNINVTDRFTAIPNITCIMERQGDFVIASENETSVNISVAKDLFKKNSSAISTMILPWTKVKQVDFDEIRAFLTLDWGIHALYYKDSNDTSYNYDIESRHAAIRAEGVAGMAESKFVGVKGSPNEESAWLVVSKEKISLLRAIPFAPELRCDVQEMLQGSSPSIFTRFHVSLAMWSPECVINQTARKCLLQKDVYIGYRPEGILGLIMDNMLVAGAGLAGSIILLVLVRKVCTSCRKQPHVPLQEEKKKKKNKKEKANKADKSEKQEKKKKKKTSGVGKKKKSSKNTSSKDSSKIQVSDYSEVNSKQFDNAEFVMSP